MSSQEFTPLLLALPSLTPSLAIELLPHGLTVHRLFVQADGRTHDLVIGPEKPEDHLDPNHAYYNTIVGRYANRIPVGSHPLERNGVTSELTAVLTHGEKVSLHGGLKGFDSKEWEVLEPNSATLFSQAEKNSIATIPSSVVFRLTSEDGDQGFPGKLLVEVLVGLLQPGQTKVTGPKDEYHLGSVVFVYRAKLVDEGKKVVTPINLTQHWGFNLEASLKDGPSSLNVLNHQLTVKADQVLELDEHALSTGKLASVFGTHHHHNSKLIGDKFQAPGYDEFYVFADSATTAIPTRLPLADLSKLDLLKDIISPPSGKSNPVVELSSSKSGLKLLFETNQPGVQFYTANFVDPAGARKKIHGGSGNVGVGDGYGPGAGAFLEFHQPLAAWLHPETTKEGEDSLITSDELYHNFVKVDVTFQNPQTTGPI